MPNAGNVRDTVFRRGMFPEGIFVGIDRLDSARQFGWIWFTSRYYVKRALPQIGIPRPFNYVSGHNFLGAIRNPHLFRYNNRLVGELISLKINIAASDAGITEGAFGDLVFRDPSDPRNPMNNKSLREVASFVDSTLTLWRRYQGRGISYIQLDSTLRRINKAFSGLMDTVSTNPLRIKSTVGLFSIPYLVPGSDPPMIVPAPQGQAIDNREAEEFSLSQNYPNPFNPLTTIEFNLPRSMVTTLRVFNILGQEVATLFDHVTLEEGKQFADFDAVNLPSGVYFYQVRTEEMDGSGFTNSFAKKMLLVK